MLFPELVIKSRKLRSSKALDAVLRDGEVLLVHSGGPIGKPGGHDQTYEYLPHPDYYWLTGFRREGGISAYSKNHAWVDFTRPVSRDEKIWAGGGHPCPGEDLTKMEDWLQKQKFKSVHHLGQHPESLGMNLHQDERNILEAFNEVRRIKDDAEIELIKKIAGIANEGYKKMASFIRPGVTERQIQIEYEMEVLRAGSEKMPYGSIVGTGTNSAILHASPSKRMVQDGDLVLIDAGADIEDYCVDITRVFSANKKMGHRQQNIYDTVLSAQTKSIELCRPGIEWSEVHLASAREISKGLIDLKILSCSVEDALESGAISVFFPHGVGHMVGLKVRDVGGPYNPNPKRYAGAKLRVDMTLKAGHLMTVEPGCYFIETLINDAETRSTFKNQINWTEAEKWIDFGGVRLEDDIHVTASGPENLTSIVAK
jgi:Xaa-Pro dipeptidase